LAQHPTKNEKLDANKIFKTEHTVISKTSADGRKLLVKTRYLSNAPGLRVLIEETPPDREFAPVTSMIYLLSNITTLTII